MCPAPGPAPPAAPRRAGEQHRSSRTAVHEPASRVARALEAPDQLLLANGEVDVLVGQLFVSHPASPIKSINLLDFTT
jgi:hypothetical protein